MGKVTCLSFSLSSSPASVDSSPSFFCLPIPNQGLQPDTRHRCTNSNPNVPTGSPPTREPTHDLVGPAQDTRIGWPQRGTIFGQVTRNPEGSLVAKSYILPQTESSHHRSGSSNLALVDLKCCLLVSSEFLISGHRLRCWAPNRAYNG